MLLIDLIRVIQVNGSVKFNHRQLMHIETNYFKVADLNFGCATFCALPSFGAVTTVSSHTTFSSHKVSVKGSDIDMCSAIYFLFDHNTKYYTIYLCPHTVATVYLLRHWLLFHQ